MLIIDGKEVTQAPFVSVIRKADFEWYYNMVRCVRVIIFLSKRRGDEGDTKAQQRRTVEEV